MSFVPLSELKNVKTWKSLNCIWWLLYVGVKLVCYIYGKPETYWGSKENVKMCKKYKQRNLDRITEWGALWFVPIATYIKDNQINMDELGVTCGMHGTENKSINNFDKSVWNEKTAWRPGRKWVVR